MLKGTRTSKKEHSGYFQTYLNKIDSYFFFLQALGPKSYYAQPWCDRKLYLFMPHIGGALLIIWAGHPSYIAKLSVAEGTGQRWIDSIWAEPMATAIVSEHVHELDFNHSPIWGQVDSCKFIFCNKENCFTGSIPQSFFSSKTKHSVNSFGKQGNKW